MFLATDKVISVVAALVAVEPVAAGSLAIHYATEHRGDGDRAILVPDFPSALPEVKRLALIQFVAGREVESK